MILECAHCIAERITEGKWDRFGTTAQQELEAMCERHLIECEKLYRGHGVPEWESWADRLVAERKRRVDLQKTEQRVQEKTTNT